MPSKTSSAARFAVALAMPARSICIRTRTLPRLRSGGLGARDGFGDARVVDRALREQAGDRVVDGVGFVALAGEALPDLHLRELAAGEHLQAVEVCGPSCQTW